MNKRILGAAFVAALFAFGVAQHADAQQVKMALCSIVPDTSQGGTKYNCVDAKVMGFVSTGNNLGVSVGTGAAVGLGCSADSTIAEIQFLGTTVNYRDDGVAPTTSTGFQVTSGASFSYSILPLSKFQAIAASGTATMNVLCYK